MIRGKLHIIGPNCGTKVQAWLLKTLTKKWTKVTKESGMNL
jgi:hypothetical protein